MKPHKILYLLLVCVIAFSCKKNDEGDNDDPNLNPGAEVDYTLLVNTADGFKAILMDANIDEITLSSVESNFTMNSEPDLNFKDESVFSFYQRSGNCSATFMKHDFGAKTSKEIDLFSDLGACNHTAYAIAHNGNKGYVAYGLNNSGTMNFFVRAFDLDGTVDDFTDVSLTKRPVHLSFANNRLFVLTIDDQSTNENSLTVIDAETNGVLTEMNLGDSAQKLLRNIDDNIIVSSDELHTLLNSQTFSPEYVRYQAGKEPLFVSSTVNNFGDEDKMYYERPSGIHSSFPVIPASFDFVENLTTLYPFEGYLTAQQSEFEYMIETTTMVGYDIKNGYMLIGYKKIGQANKGGILRVRTGVNPAVIDNIDVDGIPYNIIVM